MALGGPGSMNTINALHHSARGLNGISVPIVATIPGNGVDEANETVTDQNGLTRMRATVTELIDLVVPAAPADLGAVGGVGAGGVGYPVDVRRET